MADVSPNAKRILTIVFFALLLAAGVAFLVFAEIPNAGSGAEKVTTGLFLLLLVAAGVAYDVLAFLRGATATISQDLLAMNRASKICGFALLVGAGILIGHLSIPRDPGVIPDPPIFRIICLDLPVVGLGIWLGAEFLYQRPNQD
jgi:hypothetical protein